MGNQPALRLARCGGAEAFLQRAGPFLAAREARHNLLLGLATMLARHPERERAAPYAAVVARGEAVVAAALRTPPHNLILSETEETAAIDLLAEDARRLYPTLPGVLGPAVACRRFGDRWQASTGQPHALAVAERIYELTGVIPVSGVPGEPRRATEADRPWLEDWFQAFVVEAIPGPSEESRQAAERGVDARLSSGSDAGLWYWFDGRPVALAGYGGPTPTGIRVAPVYTPPEYRRRGYASALTAALSQALLDAGRRACFLFTDLANPTSNRIYQAIGYRPVCDVEERRFGPAPRAGEPARAGEREVVR
jgi:predicted GNAT family acetyltransferase